MTVDWASTKLGVGQWACPDHGVIDPDMTGLPHCVEVSDDGTTACMRLATEAILDARGYLVHMLPAPERCDGPEHHGRQAMTSTYRGCLCTPGGGHHVWTCLANGCGSQMSWPPPGSGPDCVMVD